MGTNAVAGADVQPLEKGVTYTADYLRKLADKLNSADVFRSEPLPHGRKTIMTDETLEDKIPESSNKLFYLTLKLHTDGHYPIFELEYRPSVGYYLINTVTSQQISKYSGGMSAYKKSFLL